MGLILWLFGEFELCQMHNAVVNDIEGYRVVESDIGVLKLINHSIGKGIEGAICMTFVEKYGTTMQSGGKQKKKLIQT